MVVNRVNLWEEYHKNPSITWKTDSGLAFAEELLHTCLEIRKEKGYPTNEKKIEHYYKKLLSIADELSEEMKRTNAPAKEVIKKYVSNLSYRDRYNLLDILDYMERKKEGANCLGKCVLFASLAEMLDSDLFYNLRHVVTPGHSFIRIKGNP